MSGDNPRTGSQPVSGPFGLKSLREPGSVRGAGHSKLRARGPENGHRFFLDSSGFHGCRKRQPPGSPSHRQHAQGAIPHQGGSAFSSWKAACQPVSGPTETPWAPLACPTRLTGVVLRQSTSRVLAQADVMLPNGVLKHVNGIHLAPPKKVSPSALFALGLLVAGIGFEPMTFRL